MTTQKSIIPTDFHQGKPSESKIKRGPKSVSSFFEEYSNEEDDDSSDLLFQKIYQKTSKRKSGEDDSRSSASDDDAKEKKRKSKTFERQITVQPISYKNKLEQMEQEFLKSSGRGSHYSLSQNSQQRQSSFVKNIDKIQT